MILKKIKGRLTVVENDIQQLRGDDVLRESREMLVQLGERLAAARAYAVLCAAQKKALADREATARAFYADFGAWARHFSTVRLTGTTFFLGAAFAALNLNSPRSPLTVAASSILLWWIAALIFFGFSYYTLNRLKRQMGEVKRLRDRQLDLDVSVKLKVSDWYSDWATWVFLFVSVGFLALWLVDTFGGLWRVVVEGLLQLTGWIVFCC